MTIKHLRIVSILCLGSFMSCAQENQKSEIKQDQNKVTIETFKEAEPHRYGGWYCPDNFGFTPVDIQKFDEVPAIIHRFPTEEELQKNMSLINVDTLEYPDARVLKMNLPRVARLNTNHKSIDELIVIIQAIVIQEDTVVGYRFANGGNGSAWLSEVRLLSETEVTELGPQPFFYSKVRLDVSTKDIWKALTKTDYFKQLGEKFDKQDFFASDWDPNAGVWLRSDKNGVSAKGNVGMVFGNLYLHIDYIKNGFHYSEKLLILENKEEQNTELHFASGPYPDQFEKKKSEWNQWIKTVKNNIETVR